MRATPRTVAGIIREVKKRWILRTIWRGVGLLLLVVLATAALLIGGVYFYDLASLGQSVVLFFGGIALLALLGWFVVRPLRNGLGEQQIALYIEEKYPALEDRLNSAVEIRSKDKNSNNALELVESVVADAVDKMQGMPLGNIIDNRKERWLLYGVGLLGIAFLFIGLNYKSTLQETAENIDVSMDPATHFGQTITITPGNAHVEKNESLEISAELKFPTEKHILLYVANENTPWQKHVMDKGGDNKQAIFRIENIESSGRYYVAVEGTKSPEFAISIYEFPKVTNIDLDYVYPDYTGLPPKSEKNTGNIRGLQGAVVTITSETNGTAVEANLIIKDSTTIAMKTLSNGQFATKLTIATSGSYYIQLIDAEGRSNKYPLEYQISPVKDQPPLITITDPQRDVRVNAVEEVVLAVDFSDDFGLKSGTLKFSVNGEAETSVSFISNSRKRDQREGNGNYVFYLEDYEMAPGDIISYYIEAADFYPRKTPALSAMYFIEVVPFDANYTQVNNQGSAGMQGGSPSVANQQMIINATWNLFRKRNQLSDREFESSAAAIEQSQQSLKMNIEQEVMNPETTLDAEGQKVFALLNQAVEAMGDAVDELAARDLQAALTPERKALNALLKAEALDKDKFVQMGGNTGSGSAINDQRLSELMDLQLDGDKDKYEMQQQRSSQQDQEVDKILEKLQELANKTQTLAHQQRENLQRKKDRRELDRLTREQEKLRQETEELASELREMSRKNSQISRQMQERMEGIAETLKEAEQEMKDENLQQSIASQNQALRELDELQERLRSSLSDNTRDILDDLAETFEELREREKKLAREIEKAEEMSYERRKSLDLEAMVEERAAQIDALEKLEEQTATAEAQSRQEHPEVASALRNLQNAINREKLSTQMNESKHLLERGWIDYAARIEEEIEFTLDDLSDEIRALGAGLPQTEEERLSDSLEETRDMLERMADAMPEENGEGQPPSGNNETPPGENPRSDAARMNRLQQQTSEMLERMQQQFNDDPAMQRALTNAGEPMNQSFKGTLLGESARKYFQNSLYDPLSQLEKYMQKRLDDIETQKKLYGLRKAEVPREYQKMVDKYFEAISK